LSTLKDISSQIKSQLSQEGRDHVEKYFRLSLSTFEAGDFALAFFFGATLFEEMAKFVIFGHKTLGIKVDEKDYRKHPKKYAHVVDNTLFVNSRVSKIYGAAESRFFRWFRTKKLFELRNAALYLEPRHGKLTTPKENISVEDAYLMVCIAGEAYAELQGILTGTGPNEWQRILQDVDQFRERHIDLLQKIQAEEERQTKPSRF